MQRQRDMNNKQQLTVEAKDVLQNINCTQATKRAEKCHFLSVVTMTLTFKPVRVRDQHIFRVNLAQIHSVVPKTLHTQTESHRQHQKQNFT